MKQFIVKLSEFVSIVCLIAFIMFVSSEGKVSEKNAEEMAESVISAVSIDGLIKADMNKLKKEFGFSEREIDSFVYYYSDSVMDVREILIIKLPEGTRADSLISAVDSRLADKKTLFESYAPQQSALLKEAVLTNEGGFVFYAVGEEADSAFTQFQNSL